jgi:enamine deaminase RidA (YjgF/YER057c/UK114 family)
MPLAYLGRMSASRILVSSGSDFESAVGYSRAVRIGPHIVVAGTTGPGPADDVGAQAREALRRIEVALNQAGATLSDVVRTRIYVTDISRWREVAAVHSEVFGEIRPAATMVEVAALIAPELLVEIEADAYSVAESPIGGKLPSAPGR